MTIVLAILAFAVMILVHEGGHFFAAKLCGVRVVEFAFGLGPSLLKKRFGETTYALRALPFGGQCVMEGEDAPSDDPRAFLNARPWKRGIILVAGVVMNFVMGFIVMLCLYAPAQGFVLPTVDTFMEKFTGGGENGIQEGDTFLEIDGYNVYLSSDITTALSKGDDAYFEVWILRGGERVHLKDVYIAPQEYELDGETVSYYGFYLQSAEATPGMTLKVTWYSCVNVVRLVVESLKQLFSGAVKITDLSGPVGISATMSDMAKRDMSDFWYLVSLISINLAVMNLLPIPALDGARLLFVLYEVIFRHPANRRVESYIHAAGLILLLLLMVFVTFHDIWKLVV
ncbi:MAG: site-2 protease family protein [Clostridiaceae bacterium]|nr:site-2 protease family protein [Clostridiaceae bacterium]